MTRRGRAGHPARPRALPESAPSVTTLNTALPRISAATRHRLERLSAGLYDQHTGRCATCCVLTGEFCHTGRHLHRVAARLETERLW